MASPQTLTLGALLRRYRLAAGLTQEELAEKAGLSVNAISAIERGVSRTPQRDTIALLAEALNLQAAERALFEQTARQRASPVSSPRRHEAASAVGEHPFVGRTVELAALDRFLANEGAPLLLVSGEPGIGKTRLLQEAATHARAAGWTVLAGGCTRRSGQEPYAPFVGTLTDWLSARSPVQQRLDLQGCAWLVRLLPELTETNVVPAPQWTLPPEQERRLVLLAVGRLLANVAGPAGTLLILDDLHWVGADTLGLLAFLLQDSSPQQLRVIGAYRDSDVDTGGPLPLLLTDLSHEGLAQPMPLTSLMRADAAMLLAALFSDESAEAERGRALAEVVLDRAEGLPFFLVSFAQEMRVGALQPGTTGSAVPWSVVESIRQRMTVLPDGAKEVLAVAAVTGRQIPRAVLLAMVRWSAREESQVLDALDIACRARLLAETPDGTYVFAHDLIRETVLADLSGARRAVLHRHVAETLEALGQSERRAAELAWHFARADEPQRALPYALLAGKRAAAVYAHAEAKRHYRMALELAREREDIEQQALALDKLGDVLIMLAEYDEARDMLELAMHMYRAGGNGAGEARAATRLGEVYRQQAMMKEGARRLAAIFRSLDARAEPATVAALCVALSGLQLLAGYYAEAQTGARRAIELSRAAGNKELEGRASKVLGTTYWSLGHLADAEAQLAQAVSLMEEIGDAYYLPEALSNLSGVERRLGHLERSRAHLERAMECAIHVGEQPMIAWLHLQFCEQAFISGEWDHARAELNAAATTLITSTWTANYHDLLAGCLDLMQGRREAGMAALERTIHLAEHIQDPQLLSYAQRYAAEYELSAGDPETAQRRLDPLVDRDLSDLGCYLATLLAWASAAQGDLEEAEAIADGAIARARLCDARLVLAEGLPIHALVATLRYDWPAAEVTIKDALERCRAIPYPWAEAKALYVYGQMCVARGELEQAREKYAAALAICERLGEGLYRPHIERALAELGATAT